MRLARELDYTPAAAARSLKTQRSHVIGVFLETGEGHPDLQHPFFHEVLVGLKHAIGASGFDLLLFAAEHPGNGYGSHAYLKRCRHHNVDGAVLTLLEQRPKAANLQGVVEPRVVAADTPGLEPATYDAILLAEVDHYFTDAPAWLKAAGAALKPEGRLVISNRIYHRQQSMANAKKAGLELVSESTPVPTHFIAVFRVPSEAKKK